MNYTEPPWFLFRELNIDPAHERSMSETDCLLPQALYSGKHSCCMYLEGSCHDSSQHGYDGDMLIHM